MEQPRPEETTDALEHDCARLFREIDILEGKKNAIQAEITAKKKEAKSVKDKLVTREMKRRAAT